MEIWLIFILSDIFYICLKFICEKRTPQNPKRTPNTLYQFLKSKCKTFLPLLLWEYYLYFICQMGRWVGLLWPQLEYLVTQILWNLKSVIPDYFLTFPFQKCTVLIYLSQLILVESKRVIKMYSTELRNCFSKFFAKLEVFTNLQTQKYMHI